MTLGDLQTLRCEFMKIYELYEIARQQTLPNWTDLSRSICAKNTTGETTNLAGSRLHQQPKYQSWTTPGQESTNYSACVFPAYARMYSMFWSCQAENVVGYLSLTYCTRYSGRWWRHCLPGLELKNSADRLAMAGLNPPLLWRFSLWWYPLRGLIIADIVAFFCIFYFQVLTRCCLVLRLTVTDHETESFTSEWRTVQTSVNNAIIVECPLAYQSP